MSSLPPSVSAQSVLPQQLVTVEDMEETATMSDPMTAILAFACPLPRDILSSIVVPEEDDDTASIGKPAALPVNLPIDFLNQGIVGTITLLGSSAAMIWFSWGRLQEASPTADHKTKTAAPTILPQPNDSSTSRPNAIKGQSSIRAMGPLVVAMPRRDFKGAFASSKPSSSKLISHGSSADAGGMTNEMIASQIAERLSQRLDMAIFVCCSLEDTPSLTGCEGIMEQHMLRSRAGAIAEKEAARLLMKRNTSSIN